MMKTVALDWKAFMNGEVVEKAKNVAPVALYSSLLPVAPLLIHAQMFTGEERLYQVFTSAGSLACNGIIIFCGYIWMFGNRTKAIDLFLSMGIGLQIIMHHTQIHDFLVSL